MTDWADVDAEADRLLAWSSSLADAARSSSRWKRASPVSVQLKTANSKIAPIRVETARSGRARFVPVGPYAATTYCSIEATCPDDCRFKGDGCYASAGASHLTMRRLDQSARGMTPLDVTLAEAAAIRGLWPRGIPRDGARGGRDLRLHVGGEVSCWRGAKALAGAAADFLARGGGRVWTYTHRWRTVDRAAWGPISVLASVEAPAEAAQALAQGYAPAVVVSQFPDEHRAFPYGSFTAVPCPAEAGTMTCVKCRLCFDDEKLRRRRLAIAFAAHGNDRDKAVRRLPVLRGVA